MGRARPTILQIIPTLDTGGAELSTVEIAEAIVRAGGRALVATEGGRLADRITAAGGEIVGFPASTKKPWRLLTNARALQGLIGRERVDLVHARSRAPAWSAFLAARRTGIPFVTTYHGAYAEKGPLKRFYNSVMARSDRVIANSDYTARLIEARYGTDPARIRVIHRGVDLAAFDPAAVAPDRLQTLRAAWGLVPGQRVVLHAARLTAWKGQRVVLEAMRELAMRDRLGDVVVVFAGDDQGRTGYRAELMATAASLGVRDHVRFAGHVADIAAALALAHVAVVASIEPEAFGRAATEAQAMGCPVIATDIGAPPETVRAAGRAPCDRYTGWLVPPDDRVALAASLETALALGHDERIRLAARARSHIAANFTLENMKAATLGVYAELLGWPPGAAASRIPLGGKPCTGSARPT